MTERAHFIPSASLQHKKSCEAKKQERVYTYDRVIVCLPKSHADADGLGKIPRKKELLASNKLLGKIRLKSSMSESKIMDEIRSVFRKPVNDDLFSVLISSSIRVLGVSV